MWLNALRPKDLSFCGRMPDERGFLRHVNLLYNEADRGTSGAHVAALSLPSLAHALGEPEAVFTWADLGALPMTVRGLISPSVRVCRACLAGGYHSALHSVRLLQTCPIHDCELEERCSCGERFSGGLVVLNRMNPGYCQCGRMAFITRQTCRRPTMRPEEAAPMSVIAAWLERLAGVVRPLAHDRTRQDAHDQPFLESVEAWFAELGLHTPGSKRAPETMTLRTSIGVPPLCTKTRGCNVHPVAHSAPEAAPSRCKHSSYWSSDEATTIYRAFLRHIRRHVARGAEAHAIDFMLHPDPLQMSATMRELPLAMVAFADLLFTECMENHAVLRRWPYRNPRTGANGSIQDGLARLAIDGSDAWPPELRGEGLSWVRRQAASAAITHAWRRAQMLAVHAVATGIADWSAATELYGSVSTHVPALTNAFKRNGTAAWFDAPPPYQVTWAAALVGQQLRFVSTPSSSRIDWTLPRRSKAQRWAMLTAAQQESTSKLNAACTGPCLSWSPQAGWEVRTSASPASVPVKRHRLLGVSGKRRCWVFLWEGRFAARACDERIQAFGPTAREAFIALRSAVRQHNRLYPRASPACLQPLAALVPLRSDAQAAYETAVAHALRDYGFWRSAQMLGNLARNHLASTSREHRKPEGR